MKLKSEVLQVESTSFSTCPLNVEFLHSSVSFLSSVIEAANVNSSTNVGDGSATTATPLDASTHPNSVEAHGAAVGASTYDRACMPQKN